MSSQTQARVGSPTSASRSSEARHVHTDAFGFHGRGHSCQKTRKPVCLVFTTCVCQQNVYDYRDPTCRG